MGALMQKNCFKCGNTKGVDDFYRHLSMKDGRLGKCKDCAKADSNANRKASLEYYRDYDRGRAMLPKRVSARAEYSISEPGRQSHKNASYRWDSGNPHKKSAQTAVNNAVRDGKLFKQPCEVCGEPETHGHHEDYLKPLEVMWLCPKHHSARHAEIRRLSA